MKPFSMGKTAFYLVPSPIGNMDDFTFRAVKVLGGVDTILAEDTRTSQKLLKHYKINKPLQSYHIHNEHKIAEKLIKQMTAGKTMALLSDAGTPGISDPGFLLVREALQAGLKIESLPGATAFLPALIKSGLPCNSFVFEGFLPHKKGRKTKLKELALEKRTIVLYESPHRIIKLLEQIKEFFGDDRIVSFSRELTKIYEETITNSVGQLLQHFTDCRPKGEFVIIISGKP